MDSAAATILFAAIEGALQCFDPALGYGQADAEGANVVVRVRPGDSDMRVTVALAEGELTGPDLRITVTPTGMEETTTVDASDEQVAR